KDKKRILAEQAAAEAERLRWEWKEASSKSAIQKYEEALAFWRDAGERWEEAAALRCIGEVHHGLGRSREALSYLQQALQISQALGDFLGEGAILNDLGSVYHQLDEDPKAADYCKRALNLGQVHDRRMEAQALSNLGDIHYFRDKSKPLVF